MHTGLVVKRWVSQTFPFNYRCQRCNIDWNVVIALESVCSSYRLAHIRLALSEDLRISHRWICLLQRLQNVSMDESQTVGYFIF